MPLRGDRARTADEDYRPLSARRRLLIALLAVATALLVAWMLLERPGAPPLQRAVPQPCAAGQTAGCVGGTQPVTLLPPDPAGSGTIGR